MLWSHEVPEIASPRATPAGRNDSEKRDIRWTLAGHRAWSAKAVAGRAIWG
jgi:hypothetical protein